MTETRRWQPSQHKPAHKSHMPKYVSIYRDLKTAISVGDLAPGEPLPSQRELSEDFGVTLMTLRQALTLLAEDGLVNTEHGRGTFVAHRPYRLPLGPLGSFAEEMRRSGRRLRTEVLDYARMRAPATVVARLSLRGELAFRLVRLRHIDDRPLLLQTSYLPLSLGRRLEIGQLADRSLYAVLDEDLEVRVARAVESIQAISLTDDDAETLQRNVSQPALLSNRLTYTDGDRPILDDRAIMPGDSVVISAERRPEDVQVNFIFGTDLATETGPSATSPSSTTPSRSPM